MYQVQAHQLRATIRLQPHKRIERLHERHAITLGWSRRPVNVTTSRRLPDPVGSLGFGRTDRCCVVVLTEPDSTLDGSAAALRFGGEVSGL